MWMDRACKHHPSCKFEVAKQNYGGKKTDKMINQHTNICGLWITVASVITIVIVISFFYLCSRRIFFYVIKAQILCKPSQLDDHMFYPLLICLILKNNLNAIFFLIDEVIFLVLAREYLRTHISQVQEEGTEIQLGTILYSEEPKNDVFTHSSPSTCSP